MKTANAQLGKGCRAVGPFTMLVGKSKWRSLLEKSWAVSLNMHLSYDSEIPFPGICPKEIKLLFAQKLYPDINSSSIHDYEQLKYHSQVNG